MSGVAFQAHHGFPCRKGCGKSCRGRFHFAATGVAPKVCAPHRQVHDPHRRQGFVNFTPGREVEFCKNLDLVGFGGVIFDAHRSPAFRSCARLTAAAML